MESVAYSDQTVRVAIDGNGIAHLEVPSGGGHVDLAIPVSQLIKNIGACNRAIAEWNRCGRTAEVIPFRGHG